LFPLISSSITIANAFLFDYEFSFELMTHLGFHL